MWNLHSHFIYWDDVKKHLHQCGLDRTSVKDTKEVSSLRHLLTITDPLQWEARSGSFLNNKQNKTNKNPLLLAKLNSI